jgi:excisionase family DNA binding protein
MIDARPTDWSQVPVVLDVQAAGRLLGLGKNATYQALAAGELPSLRIGRRLLVPRDRLRAMLENVKTAPDGQIPGAAEGGRRGSVDVP